MLNNVNESHVNRYRIVLAANICRPEERQEKKRKKEKDLEVRVYLLLTGVINSGGALVRDLSTQIWITRQKNLTRSNLCVWYLHESKRECETSAATMGIHMFFHPFFSLPGVDLHLCREKYCVCQKKKEIEKIGMKVDNVKTIIFWSLPDLKCLYRERSKAGSLLNKIQLIRVWTDGCLRRDDPLRGQSWTFPSFSTITSCTKKLMQTLSTQL